MFLSNKGSENKEKYLLTFTKIVYEKNIFNGPLMMGPGDKLYKIRMCCLLRWELVKVLYRTLSFSLSHLGDTVALGTTSSLREAILYLDMKICMGQTLLPAQVLSGL